MAKRVVLIILAILIAGLFTFLYIRYYVPYSDSGVKAGMLNNVKHIACVNHHLHYHDTADMPREKLEEHFLNV